jgi:ATP-dependent RNA helicase DDX10/DBP4
LTIQPVLEKMNAENKDLQHLAKRAVVSYLRSVHLMRDKTVFKIDEIDKQKLATSYGLLNAPTVEIVSRKDKGDRVAMLREQAQARKMAKSLGKEIEMDDSSEEEQSAKSEGDDFFRKADKIES